MTTRMGSGLASGKAGREVGREAAEKAIIRMGGRDGIVLTIVFASTDYDLAEVLKGVRDVVGLTQLMGCSSAGEFSDETTATGAVAVTTLASTNLKIRLGVGRDLREDLTGAVSQMIGNFAGNTMDALREGYMGRTLLLVSDALVGRTEELIDELMTRTSMQYQLIGGGAGDDARFKKTYVFYQDEVLSNACVCAEILSERPMPIGLSHGWKAVSRPIRATGTDGMIVCELNGRPAWEVYREFADEMGISINDEGETSGFLLDNPLGVTYAPDEYKIRIPLWRRSDGSLFCAGEVPKDSIVRIMCGEDNALIRSGGQAVEAARRQIDNGHIVGALFFECAATRLKLKDKFPQEVEAMKRAIGAAPFMGCNSYGQLVRVKGQFTGLMNAAAVVCLFIE